MNSGDSAGANMMIVKDVMGVKVLIPILHI